MDEITAHRLKMYVEERIRSLMLSSVESEGKAGAPLLIKEEALILLTEDIVEYIDGYKEQRGEKPEC